MIADPTVYIAICLGLFLLGLFAGRFLNRAILRLPRHFEVIPAWKGVFAIEKRPGIYPPNRWYHCLPVVGTASLVGRSPYTGRRILAREPWLELLNGSLFVLAFVCMIPLESWNAVQADCLRSPLWAGEIYHWESVSHVFLWSRYFYFLFLIETLFVASFIDFDLWIIPDGVTFPAMVVGIIGQTLGIGFFLVPVWFQDPNLLHSLTPLIPALQWWPVQNTIPDWIIHHPVLHGFSVSAVGFLVGGGIVWAVRIIGGLILKREAMGFGDVILMAMIGSFIGWQPVVMTFFVAPVIALVVFVGVLIINLFSRQEFTWAMPYGPYLSIATLFVLFGWRHLWLIVDRIFMPGPLLLVFAFAMLIMLAFSLFVIQGLKWLVGIDPWPEDEPIWRSADQLHHFSGETIDPNQGNWKRNGWSGTQSGRGQLNEHRWRNRCQ